MKIYLWQVKELLWIAQTEKQLNSSFTSCMTSFKTDIYNISACSHIALQLSSEKNNSTPIHFTAK